MDGHTNWIIWIYYEGMAKESFGIKIKAPPFAHECILRVCLVFRSVCKTTPEQRNSWWKLFHFFRSPYPDSVSTGGRLTAVTMNMIMMLAGWRLCVTVVPTGSNPLHIDLSHIYVFHSRATMLFLAREHKKGHIFDFALFCWKYKT